MYTITASEARANIFRLMEQIAKNHEPMMVTGKHANVVMISEEDWRGIQETIYLSSIPGMVESIVEGAKTPIEDCIPIEDLKW
ncbi:MAG: type II toxin-antitoxin system Phd/YefM family antitoxin [Rickettsiales bacterium]